MKQLYILFLSLFFLSIFSASEAYGQNRKTHSYIDYSKSFERPDVLDGCYESGGEEYVVDVRLYNDETGWCEDHCRKCNNNGNCTNDDDACYYATSETHDAIELGMYMKAWEDDSDPRCDYNDNNDDCLCSEVLFYWTITDWDINDTQEMRVQCNNDHEVMIKWSWIYVPVVQPSTPAVSGNSGCFPTLTSVTSNQDNVTWYWQTSSNGTSMDYESDNPPTPSVGTTTYYLRGRGNRNNVWGTASTGVVVTRNTSASGTAAASPTQLCGIGNDVDYSLNITSGTFVKWYYQWDLTNDGDWGDWYTVEDFTWSSSSSHQNHRTLHARAKLTNGSCEAYTNIVSTTSHQDLPTPTTSSTANSCNTVGLTASGLAPGGGASGVAVFDGNDDYADLGDAAELNITGNQTIEMWLKPTDFTDRRNPYSKAYGGEGAITIETDGDVSYYYGSTGDNSAPYETLRSNTKITAGAWTHIAIVRDFTDPTNRELRWYINGYLDTKKTVSITSATAGSNAALIGYGYTGHHYLGQMDNIRIWNDVRDREEIVDNMFLETPASRTNLVAHYKMNGDMNDAQGTELTISNGTPNGGITYTSQDYYTYTWSGTSAPSASTNETQTTSALNSAGTYDYSVVATNGSGCPSASSNTTTALVAVSVTSANVNETCIGDGDGEIDVTLGGLSGVRYIKLYQNTDENINLEELEAIEIFTGSNVALGKSVSAASTWVNSSGCTGASAPCSGLTSGYSNGTGGTNMYHSDNSPSAGTEWVEVDLGAGYNLDYVRIYNRYSGAKYRANDLTLELRDASNIVLYSEDIDIYNDGVGSQGSNADQYLDVNVLDVSWSPTHDSLDLTGLDAGTYTLTYSDVAGCSENTDITLAVTPPPADPVAVVDLITLCEGDDLTLEVEQMVPGNQWATFDGNNDVIDMGGFSAMDDPNNFSFTLWFNRTSDNNYNTGHGINNVLVGHGGNSGNDNFEIGTDGADIELYLDGTFSDINGSYNVGIENNKWYHLGFTYDGATVKIYLNGYLVVTDNSASGHLKSAVGSDFGLGAGKPGDGKTGDFTGHMDEFRLYDITLSQAEIQQYMHVEMELGDANYDDLISYMRLDGDAIAEIGTGGTVVGTTFSPATEITYHWSGPNSFSTTTTDPTTTISSITAAGDGTYSVYATNSTCPSPQSGTETIEVNVTAVTAASSTPTLCINTALSPTITHNTTGATGITDDGVTGANGLPAGVSATWSGDEITISGTPTASGTFGYTIPLEGGCGSVDATGTITVTAANTAGAASSTPTLCINTALTAITHTTTGATGITNDGVAGANGLPAGVSATWSGNEITISGTPTASGTFGYTIPLEGGCGIVNATGTITLFNSPTTQIYGGTTLCNGESASLTSNAVTTAGTVTYLWEHSTDGGSNWSTAGTGSGSLSPSPTVSTLYRLTVGSDGVGCSSYTSNTVAVIVTDAPDDPVAVVDPISLCEGDDLTLEVEQLVPGGQWAHFDGNDAFIDFGDLAYMNAPSAFSFTLWFNRDVDNPSGSSHGINNVLVAKGSDQYNDNLELGTSGSKIELYLDATIDINIASYPAGIENDTWYHLGFTYDGATVKIYINGDLIVSDATASGSLANSTLSPFALGVGRPGNFTGGPDRNGDFNGYMDEFRLFRTTLSQANIQSLMGTEMESTDSDWGSLETYLRLDDVNCDDESPNGNDGTPTGNVSFSAATDITYHWTDPNSAVTTTTDPTTTISSITAAAAGTYSVYATNSICPSLNSGTETIEVIVSEPSSIGTYNDAGPVETCQHNGVIPQISVSGYTGSLQWEWGSSNGNWNTWNTGEDAGTSQFRVNPSITSADRIRVIATNGGCPSDTGTTVLIENQNTPAPSSLTSSETTVCSGASGNITLTATFPYGVNTASNVISNYSMVEFFSESCGGTSLGTASHVDGEATLDIALPTGTTTYYARGYSDCETSLCASVVVTVVADPSAPTITRNTDNTVCVGTMLSVNISAGSGGTGTCNDEYQYSTDGGSTWSGWSTSVPSFAAVAGNLNIIQSRRDCDGTGCTTSGVNEVEWGVAPSVSLSSTKTDEGCPASNNGTIDVTLSGGLSSVRYIKVYQNRDEHLGLDEIEAYEVFTGTNVAFGVSTISAASTWATGVGCAGGSHPCSGLTNGVQVGNGYHSDNTPAAGTEWAEVDLGAGFNLDYVRIYSRFGGFKWRNDDLTVELRDAGNNVLYIGDIDIYNDGVGSQAGGQDQYLDINVLDLSWSTTPAPPILGLDLTGLDAGTYELTYADEAGCSVGPTAQTINTTNTNSSAPSSLTADPMNVCNGGAVDLTVVGGSLGTGGSWYLYNGDPGSGGTFIDDETDGIFSGVVVTADTDYYVRAEGTCNTVAALSTPVNVWNVNDNLKLPSKVPGLANNLNLAEQCTTTDGWTYYGESNPDDPTEPEWYFAIKKNGNNLAYDIDLNTNSGTPGVVESVKTTYKQHGSFLMNRYWNVHASGDPDQNGGISIRFYYDPADLAAAKAARDAFALTYPCCGAAAAYAQWFKTDAYDFGEGKGGYHPSLLTTHAYGNDWSFDAELLPALGGNEGADNVRYIQFDGITSLSGGTSGYTYGQGPPLLPVEMISFTASADDEDITLDWITATEINNEKFEVYRSFDGVTFDYIDEIEGNGTTSTPHAYSLIDEDVAKNVIHYYKLKQVDFNGQYEWTEIVSAIVNTDGRMVIGNLIPNPAHQQTYIEIISPKDTRFEYTITNVIGEQIMTDEVEIIEGTQRIYFDVDQLVPGNYLISLFSDQGMQAVRKLQVIK